MSAGRIVGAATASVAVVGCTALVVGMSGAASRPAGHVSQADARLPLATSPSSSKATSKTSSKTAASHPAEPIARPSARASRAHPTPSATATTVPARHLSGDTPTFPTASPAVTHSTPTSTPTARSTTPARPTSPAPTAAHRSARPSTSSAAPRPRTRAPRPRVTSHRTPTVRATTHPAPRPSHTTHTATPARKGVALPLHFSTGSARKVITVSAQSHSSTTATLQAWSKAGGGGWLRHGPAITAHVGSDGVRRDASESRSATPVGSFTLTRAFGHDSNPGTSLPYVHTTPAAWWISQPGKLYNTLQVCSSHCGFHQGSPNEHLYYETPFYDYAVVIDYNTRNAPGGVHQGAGSAFFLHVTDGNPTAGCVSIPRAQLTSIMRWLTPQSHARILIGVRP